MKKFVITYSIVVLTVFVSLAGLYSILLNEESKSIENTTIVENNI